MLNKYLEDALKLSKTHSVDFEEVKTDWEDGCKLLRFDFHDYPLNVDIYNFEDNKLKKHDKVNLKLALFFDSDGEVFHNKNEYYSENKRAFAAESVCPCGTFDPKCRQDFEESARVIYHGKIISVAHVLLDDVESLHIVFTCLGKEYDYFIDEGIMPFAEPGNIISGIFYTVGLVETAVDRTM